MRQTEQDKGNICIPAESVPSVTFVVVVIYKRQNHNYTDNNE